MSTPIEDYALIGDCETAALVVPQRIDRLAVLAAFRCRGVLRRAPRRPENGHWSIAPAEAARITRRYRDDTLVLETVFETEEGAAR